MITEVKSEWSSLLGRPAFRWQFLLSVGLLIVTLHVFTNFLGWVEQREGAVLQDPLLRLIEPQDFTGLRSA
jgi:hypothetical protein